jgi:multiple sugar transport system permease protein
VSAVASRRRGLGWAPYLLILPSLVFLVVFFAVPMFQAFGLALQAPSGSGYSLDAIRQMLHDVPFSSALTNTLLLMVAIIPIQFVVAMAMALVINAQLKGSSLGLYIFALPLGISELVSGLVWFSIFTEQGWLNSILQQLGITSQSIVFLDYQRTWLVLGTIVLAEAWRATALIMVILVAGLQSIPRDYLEAADVFGAGLWQRLRHVILPLLKPSIRVALILRTILALQVFATVLALGGGNTTVLANEAYRWFYRQRDPRVAAAYASLVLLLSLICTVVYLTLIRTHEEQRA